MCNKTSRHRSTSSVCRCRRQIHVEKCICLHNYVIKTKAPVVTTTRGRFDTNPITTGRAWICRIHACSSNVSYVYDIKYYWLNTFWIKKSPFFCMIYLLICFGVFYLRWFLKQYHLYLLYVFCARHGFLTCIYYHYYTFCTRLTNVLQMHTIRLTFSTKRAMGGYQRRNWRKSLKV